MKKLLFVLFGIMVIAGCRKDPFVTPPVVVDNSLNITQSVGIKLQSQFVTSEVAMNVKIDAGQNVTIKIFDIANRVVSKETMWVNSGDNILKVYTSTLPSSAYRIGLFDSNGKQLGITDFNKL
jgi:uncharacterized lipoprotein YajG